MIDRLDRIHIRDLRVRCIIGVNDDERREKQDVAVHITLFADLRRAGETDDIEQTVNYRTIKKDVLAMVEASRFYLLERLAERVAEICLGDERVRRARVLVEKPGALRFARTVAIEIDRERAADEGE
ncbi:MAG: dihydroneopterin aldolase [Planctomycetes bacterium]|nr:dihydroneopterin aldolase [Planctomycetota bacterium]